MTFDGRLCAKHVEKLCEQEKAVATSETLREHETRSCSTIVYNNYRCYDLKVRILAN